MRLGRNVNVELRRCVLAITLRLEFKLQFAFQRTSPPHKNNLYNNCPLQRTAYFAGTTPISAALT